MNTTDLRKAQRFDLSLPIELATDGAGKSSVTKNLSSCGVLFTSDAHMPPGEPIQYSISLPTGLLICVGKVIRSEKHAPKVGGKSKGFRVAATMERYEFVRP